MSTARTSGHPDPLNSGRRRQPPARSRRRPGQDPSLAAQCLGRIRTTDDWARTGRQADLARTSAGRHHLRAPRRCPRPRSPRHHGQGQRTGLVTPGDGPRRNVRASGSRVEHGRAGGKKRKKRGKGEDHQRGGHPPTWPTRGGKASPRVDYVGPGSRGQTVGVAILNHPESFRYPTTWHVRDYGLFRRELVRLARRFRHEKEGRAHDRRPASRSRSATGWSSAKGDT